MFFNGFTLLMMLLSGATGYWIGNYFGYDRGKVDNIKLTIEYADKRREFFQKLSNQNSASSLKEQKRLGL
jgi:hypothetical protein